MIGLLVALTGLIGGVGLGYWVDHQEPHDDGDGVICENQKSKKLQVTSSYYGTVWKWQIPKDYICKTTCHGHTYICPRDAKVKYDGRTWSWRGDSDLSVIFKHRSGYTVFFRTQDGFWVDGRRVGTTEEEFRK